MDVDDLLKLILVLVVVWIGLQVLELTLDILFGPFSTIVGLIIIVLIVLYFLDRI